MSIRVNLLPHRELKRAARRRQFNFMLAAALIAGVAVVIIGHTVIAASDQDAEVRKEATSKKKTDVAGLVGTALGKRAKEKGISAVVFDRGGFRYHGRVKALAEAVRKAGVTF